MAACMRLSTSIPPYGDHVVAPKETELEDILHIGKEEARRRERKICNSSNFDDDGTGDNDTNLSEAFFVVDVRSIERKYHRWRECFPRIKPFYVVQALASLEYCGIDCSSAAEISLALNCGVEPKNIIYANPCKPLDDIKFAIKRYVRTMTFDAVCELHKVRRALDAMKQDTSEAVSNEEELDVDLLLRIRVPDETSTTPLGEKFGATFEECASLIDIAKDLSLKIVGVSGLYDAGAFRDALKMASQVLKLAESMGVILRLVDIGGGFPGWDGSEFIPEGSSFPQSLSLKDIADATNPLLSELFTGNTDVRFIAEPGRYFVEASHTLFTRIYTVRPIRLRDESSDMRSPTWQYYTACFIGEGVYGCFKDKILCGVDYELLPLKLSTGKQAHMDENDHQRQQQQPKGDCIFIGPACIESDIVCLPSTQNNCPMPILQQGDWVYAMHMGAYTASIAYNLGAVANSVCIQQDPPIYVIEIRNSHFQL